MPTTANVVILSGVRSTKSKDLRTELTHTVDEMPRSFDSLLLHFGMIATGNHL